MTFLEQLIPWFIQYKYFIIFPIAVVEGPIITIISGFLASLGYLNLSLAYVIVVLADLVGDTIYYSIGKFGRAQFIEKYGRLIGVSTESLHQLEKHFQNHAYKTLAAGKFAQGVGSIVLVASGAAHTPYKILLTTNFFTTSIKSLIFILIGFYFGKAYERFNAYLNYAAIIFLVLFIGTIIIVRTKLLSKIINKL